MLLYNTMVLSENVYPVPIGEPLAKEYETLTREELKNRLTVYISDLLDHDFEKLCHMIYRHDVDERKFHTALNTGDIEGQSSRLAELVIEREMQKVETRKAYRKHMEEKESKELNR